ncbi:glycosyltransferase [Pedobacter sp.]|uniref:glycosyltransferase n=1 Tax=Pedobacter sp. TaxID=1411316 RepID=UPI003BACDD1B
MIEMPLISIAVCTFNGEKYLSAQLDSLVNQDYPNKQIVVVDDGSNDDTMSILRRYETEYSFFKVYQNEQNLGYIKNFERAITLSKGELIALCDQDDIWDLKKLSILSSHLKEEDILIYHDSLMITADGKSMGKSLSKAIGYIDGKEHRSLLLNNCMAGHAMLIKKTLLEMVLPLPLDIPHDHWIAYNALSIGNVRYLKQNLVCYRQHEHTVTFTHHLKKLKEVDPGFEKLTKRRNINSNRIKHLAVLISANISTSEAGFIERLRTKLSTLNEKTFSTSLFFFLTWHQSSLFKLYHKSFFSRMILIFKESKGLK